MLSPRPVVVASLPSIYVPRVVALVVDLVLLHGVPVFASVSDWDAIEWESLSTTSQSPLLLVELHPASIGWCLESRLWNGRRSPLRWQTCIPPALRLRMVAFLTSWSLGVKSCSAPGVQPRDLSREVESSASRTACACV